MIRTQIYLTEEERAALKRLAEKRGTWHVAERADPGSG
jgi:hypothetical protein